MSSTTKPAPEQARAARAQRVSMLRNRAMAGVIATFVLALGTVGFTGAMGAPDSASSGTTAGLVDSTSASAGSAGDDATSTWHLQPDGEWERHTTGLRGEPLADLQSVLISRQRRRPGSAR